ncbi:hypothetical protein SAMN05216238_10555 [Lentibacillus persicus]|uniref:Uncharacterized protein n=1 Tax=Lentibacillus persicus TaxID=640948 RepID=A0A1I1W1E8_9BACI|nr:hypothetical protein SAMN05216238_10555 [Lentibacillus persicus]
MKNKILFLISIISALILLTSCGENADGSGNADNYPSDSITYSIPFDPGGSQMLRPDANNPIWRKL